MLRAATLAGGAAIAYLAGKNVQAGRDQDASQSAEIDTRGLPSSDRMLGADVRSQP